MKRMHRVGAALLAAPFFLFASGCGGSTPAADAIHGEATGDYEGISGGDTPPAMEMYPQLDTIPDGARPDTTPIPSPPPPEPQPPQT